MKCTEGREINLPMAVPTGVNRRADLDVAVAGARDGEDRPLPAGDGEASRATRRRLAHALKRPQSGVIPLTDSVRHCKLQALHARSWPANRLARRSPSSV